MFLWSDLCLSSKGVQPLRRLRVSETCLGVDASVAPTTPWSVLLVGLELSLLKLSCGMFGAFLAGMAACEGVPRGTVTDLLGCGRGGRWGGQMPAGSMEWYEDSPRRRGRSSMLRAGKGGLGMLLTGAWLRDVLLSLPLLLTFLLDIMLTLLLLLKWFCCGRWDNDAGN